MVAAVASVTNFFFPFRYNGGEGFVPGALFRKFDRRQATVYVKNVRTKMLLDNERV